MLISMMIYLVEWLTVVISGLALGAMVLLSVGMDWPWMLVPASLALLLARWLYRRMG